MEEEIKEEVKVIKEDVKHKKVKPVKRQSFLAKYREVK